MRELEETVQLFAPQSGLSPDDVKRKTVEEFYNWLRAAVKIRKKISK